MKIEIRHMLSSLTRELALIDRNEAVIRLGWPTVGVLSFDVATGEGIDPDTRDWELSPIGRETLGLEPPRGRGQRGRQIDRVRQAAQTGEPLDKPRTGKKPHPKQIGLFTGTK